MTAPDLRCEDCYHLDEIAGDLSELSEWLCDQMPPDDTDWMPWLEILSDAIAELQYRHKMEVQAEIVQRKAAGEHAGEAGMQGR